MVEGSSSRVICGGTRVKEAVRHIVFQRAPHSPETNCFLTFFPSAGPLL